MRLELDVLLALVNHGALLARESLQKEAARKNTVARFVDILAQLPHDQRKVIILRHLQGLSYPEVAICIGRSKHAVQKAWIRALATIGRLSKLER